MGSVGEELPREQARCREIQRRYAALGPVGQFGWMVIEQILERADYIVMSGDTVEMIRILAELRDVRE